MSWFPQIIFHNFAADKCDDLFSVSFLFRFLTLIRNNLNKSFESNSDGILFETQYKMKQMSFDKMDFTNLKSYVKEKTSTHIDGISESETDIAGTESAMLELIDGIEKKESLQTLSELIHLTSTLKDFFDYAPVCYFVLDEQGTIRFVNKTCLEKTGMNRDNLVGKSFASFMVVPAYLDSYNQHIKLVTASTGSEYVECEIKKQGDHTFFAHLVSKIVRDDQANFNYLLTTVSDISAQKTERQKLELSLINEKKLNELKSQFITIASHEFRTPLTTILSSAELMRKFHKLDDEDKQAKHFHKITTAVSRLKEILIDFLSAERLEKDKITLSPQSFNLPEFVKNIIDELKAFNGIHNISYKHVGSYATVFLDKKLLKTCISNLIINAYKYSPQGGTITIITEQSVPEVISFSIKDNGIGIPESDKPFIFERFFRARNVSHFQGTGLGLNITKELTELMGGTIWFISEENKGTTFFLHFPGKG